MCSLRIILPLAVAVVVPAFGDNGTPIKATVHRKVTRTRPDGSAIGGREMWGQFYRSPTGSTLTIFYDQSDNSPQTGTLYNSELGRNYQINYAKGTFIEFPTTAPPAGITIVPPGSLPSPSSGTNQPTQTVNGVPCVLTAVKGSQITTGAACYSAQFQLTIKMETTSVTEAETDSTLVEYLNVAIDTEQHAPTFFQLPPGLTQVPPITASGPPPAVKHY